MENLSNLQIGTNFKIGKSTYKVISFQTQRGERVVEVENLKPTKRAKIYKTLLSADTQVEPVFHSKMEELKFQVIKEINTTGNSDCDHLNELLNDYVLRNDTAPFLHINLDAIQYLAKVELGIIK